mmetsp:Transcript_14357/g.36622  ORF Transcript_14357/g.36622 Transcript_14357/m.36622 type:complete len:239 (-) Transcript_14357:464-1180(-)
MIIPRLVVSIHNRGVGQHADQLLHVGWVGEIIFSTCEKGGRNGEGGKIIVGRSVLSIMLLIAIFTVVILAEFRRPDLLTPVHHVLHGGAGRSARHIHRYAALVHIAVIRPAQRENDSIAANRQLLAHPRKQRLKEVSAGQELIHADSGEELVQIDVHHRFQYEAGLMAHCCDGGECSIYCDGVSQRRDGRKASKGNGSALAMADISNFRSPSLGFHVIDTRRQIERSHFIKRKLPKFF